MPVIKNINLANKHRDSGILSEALSFWLNADGSLTALLEEKAGQPLIVERTFEGYLPLTLNQKKQMGYKGYQLTRPAMAWVRQTNLYGNNDNPWIAAQSIFPIKSLKGEAKRFKGLKSTPIGYVLFKRQNSLPSKRCLILTKQGWQRQTLYNWHERPIVISETFLDAFLNDLS